MTAATRASTAPGSLDEEEIRRVVDAVTAEGLIDFLDVSVGDYYRMDAMVSGMHSPTGYELPSSARITEIGTARANGVGPPSRPSAAQVYSAAATPNSAFDTRPTATS